MIVGEAGAGEPMEVGFQAWGFCTSVLAGFPSLSSSSYMDLVNGPLVRHRSDRPPSATDGQVSVDSLMMVLCNGGGDASCPFIISSLQGGGAAVGSAVRRRYRSIPENPFPHPSHQFSLAIAPGSWPLLLPAIVILPGGEPVVCLSALHSGQRCSQVVAGCSFHTRELHLPSSSTGCKSCKKAR